MTKVSELVSQNVGNQIINSQTWASVIYNVKNPTYGVKGNGTTNDTAGIAAAIAAAAVSGGIVMFPAGTYITDNQTVPANVTLWFANGAKLSINTGATVTINGPIDAGLYQIFSGAGLVRGTPLIDKVFPQWFGVVGDGSDIRALLQKVIDFVVLNGIKVYFKNGTYYCSTGGGINIPYGRPNKIVTFEGESQQGAVLVYNQSSGTFININPVQARPDPQFLGISSFGIFNLTLSGLGGTSTATALKIGKGGFVCDSTGWNIVENLTITNFGEGIYLESCRHIAFNNVAVEVSGQRALNLQCNTINETLGDLNFNACEFVAGSDMAILFMNTATATSGGIGGIHFNDCIIYGSTSTTRTVFMNSTANGRIADLFFNACALDQGTTCNAFEFNIGGASETFNITINNCYVVGYLKFLHYSNASTAAIKGRLQVIGNIVGQTPTPFYMSVINGVIIANNFFEDVTQKSTIDGASKNIQILGNRFNAVALLPAQCVTITATVLSAIVKDNIGNFANASTFLENLTTLPATRLVNADNLQTV